MVDLTPLATNRAPLQPVLASDVNAICDRVNTITQQTSNVIWCASTLPARPTVPPGFLLIVVGPSEPTWLQVGVDIMFMTAA
jgi:hypothetical protein